MLRHLPNLLTGARLLLTPGFVWLLLEERYTEALLLFALMGVSDALDGFLAKHYRWQSALGALLDPLADKVMLVSAYLALTWQNLIPAWLTAFVLGRDFLIMSGALAYQWATRRLEIRPSAISKVNTFVQILLVLAVIANQILPLPTWMLSALIWLTLGTTLASGAGYVWTSSRRLLQQT
jgi:cardiolipin synthase (CMP-forming)